MYVHLTTLTLWEKCLVKLPERGALSLRYEKTVLKILANVNLLIELSRDPQEPQEQQELQEPQDPQELQEPQNPMLRKKAPLRKNPTQAEGVGGLSHF